MKLKDAAAVIGEVSTHSSTWLASAQDGMCSNARDAIDFKVK